MTDFFRQTLARQRLFRNPAYDQPQTQSQYQSAYTPPQPVTSEISVTPEVDIGQTHDATTRMPQGTENQITGPLQGSLPAMMLDAGSIVSSPSQHRAITKQTQQTGERKNSSVGAKVDNTPKKGLPASLTNSQAQYVDDPKDIFGKLPPSPFAGAKTGATLRREEFKPQPGTTPRKEVSAPPHTKDTQASRPLLATLTNNQAWYTDDTKGIFDGPSRPSPQKFDGEPPSKPMNFDPGINISGTRPPNLAMRAERADAYSSQTMGNFRQQESLDAQAQKQATIEEGTAIREHNRFQGKQDRFREEQKKQRRAHTPFSPQGVEDFENNYQDSIKQGYLGAAARGLNRFKLVGEPVGSSDEQVAKEQSQDSALGTVGKTFLESYAREAPVFIAFRQAALGAKAIGIGADAAIGATKIPGIGRYLGGKFAQRALTEAGIGAAAGGTVAAAREIGSGHAFEHPVDALVDVGKESLTSAALFGAPAGLGKPAGSLLSMGGGGKALAKFGISYGVGKAMGQSSPDALFQSAMAAVGGEDDHAPTAKEIENTPPVTQTSQAPQASPAMERLRQEHLTGPGRTPPRTGYQAATTGLGSDPNRLTPAMLAGKQMLTKAPVEPPWGGAPWGEPPARSIARIPSDTGPLVPPANTGAGLNDRISADYNAPIHLPDPSGFSQIRPSAQMDQGSLDPLSGSNIVPSPSEARRMGFSIPEDANTPHQLGLLTNHLPTDLPFKDRNATGPLNSPEPYRPEIRVPVGREMLEGMAPVQRPGEQRTSTADLNQSYADMEAAKQERKKVFGEAIGDALSRPRRSQAESDAKYGITPEETATAPESNKSLLPDWMNPPKNKVAPPLVPKVEPPPVETKTETTVQTKPEAPKRTPIEQRGYSDTEKMFNDVLDKTAADPKEVRSRPTFPGAIQRRKIVAKIDAGMLAPNDPLLQGIPPEAKEAFLSVPSMAHSPEGHVQEFLKKFYPDLAENLEEGMKGAGKGGRAPEVKPSGVKIPGKVSTTEIREAAVRRGYEQGPEGSEESKRGVKQGEDFAAREKERNERRGIAVSDNETKTQMVANLDALARNAGQFKDKAQFKAKFEEATRDPEQTDKIKNQYKNSARSDKADKEGKLSQLTLGGGEERDAHINAIWKHWEKLKKEGKTATSLSLGDEPIKPLGGVTGKLAAKRLAEKAAEPPKEEAPPVPFKGTKSLPQNTPPTSSIKPEGAAPEQLKTKAPAPSPMNRAEMHKENQGVRDRQALRAAYASLDRKGKVDWDDMAASGAGPRAIAKAAKTMQERGIIDKDGNKIGTKPLPPMEEAIGDLGIGSKKNISDFKPEAPKAEPAEVAEPIIEKPVEKAAKPKGRPRKVAPVPTKTTGAVPQNTPPSSGIKMGEESPLAKERIETGKKQDTQGPISVGSKVVRTDTKVGDPYHDKLGEVVGVDEKSGLVKVKYPQQGKGKNSPSLVDAANLKTTAGPGEAGFLDIGDMLRGIGKAGGWAAKKTGDYLHDAASNLVTGLIGTAGRQAHILGVDALRIFQELGRVPGATLDAAANVLGWKGRALQGPRRNPIGKGLILNTADATARGIAGIFTDKVLSKEALAAKAQRAPRTWFGKVNNRWVSSILASHDALHGAAYERSVNERSWLLAKNSDLTAGAAKINKAARTVKGYVNDYLEGKLQVTPEEEKILQKYVTGKNAKPIYQQQQKVVDKFNQGKPLTAAEQDIYDEYQDHQGRLPNIQRRKAQVEIAKLVDTKASNDADISNFVNSNIASRILADVSGAAKKGELSGVAPAIDYYIRNYIPMTKVPANIVYWAIAAHPEYQAIRGISGIIKGLTEMSKTGKFPEEARRQVMDAAGKGLVGEALMHAGWIAGGLIKATQPTPYSAVSDKTKAERYKNEAFDLLPSSIQFPGSKVMVQGAKLSPLFGPFMRGIISRQEADEGEGYLSATHNPFSKAAQKGVERTAMEAAEAFPTVTAAGDMLKDASQIDSGKALISKLAGNAIYAMPGGGAVAEAAKLTDNKERMPESAKYDFKRALKEDIGKNIPDIAAPLANKAGLPTRGQLQPRISGYGQEVKRPLTDALLLKPRPVQNDPTYNTLTAIGMGINKTQRKKDSKGNYESLESYTQNQKESGILEKYADQITTKSISFKEVFEKYQKDHNPDDLDTLQEMVRRARQTAASNNRVEPDKIWYQVVRDKEKKELEGGEKAKAKRQYRIDSIEDEYK